MAKKLKPAKPAEIPKPRKTPEIKPPADPEELPAPAEDPDIIPDIENDETAPYEIPPPGEGP